jgi:tetratricopeptide (TPR) repeat protein
VIQSAQTLRHLAFFEALAELEESDAAWRSTSAGLVVLRLFDDWMEHGPFPVGGAGWGIRAIRDAIDAVDEGNPARLILAGVVDAIASGAEPPAVTPRLLAYARALHYTADWRLSADVYHTVVAHAHPIEESDSVIDANMQYGYCSRMLGRWDEAALAYSQAGEIAVAVGDIVKVLRARVADAKLAIDRGNLPKAEIILDETVARATDPAGKLSEVRSLALHERAGVAILRGQYENAVRFAYEALDGMSNPADRDRVLADIAAAFVELGVLSAARDALVVLAATAQEQYLRWAATVNLLEVAGREGCEPVFEQYRRQLADAPLPASLEANYYLVVGKGYAGFGRVEPARSALTKAIDVATHHAFHQLVHAAEAELRELERAEVTRRKVSDYQPSADVEEIVAAIHGMREEAEMAR